MEAIKERMRKRDLYIKNARIFAECVINILSSSTILVFGSVSRGDFNEWSDIDILIITRDTIPQKPSERLDVIHECMRENPLVEPVIITLNEFYKLLAKRNPLVIEALEKGTVLIDRLGLKDRPPTPDR